MKNTIIIGGLLVVCAVSAWALSRDDGKESIFSEEKTVTLVAEESVVEETDVTSGKGSLFSLLARGKSQECTFVVRTEGLLQEGTAFYDGDNARVDTLISGAEATEPIASYMIMDKAKSTMYMWGSAQENQGIKMALTEPTTDKSESGPAVAPEAVNQGVTPGIDVDYNCKSWQVDGSVFVPPADIEFMDMTEMQKMMEGMSGMEGMVPRP